MALSPSRSMNTAPEDIRGLIAGGRFEAAQMLCETALKDNPRDAGMLCLLGDIQAALGDVAAARQNYRKALSGDPENPGAHIGLAKIHAASREHDKALDCLKKAGGSAEGLFAYGLKLELMNRPDEARAQMEEGRRRHPGEPSFLYLHAKLEKREGNFKEALQLLDKIPADGPYLAPYLPVAIIFERAALLDKLGQYDEAWPLFERANRAALAAVPGGALLKDDYTRQLQRYRITFTREWVESWQEADGFAEPDPVFLVGFPRSGTTLLDQILSAHKDIVTMEEVPAVLSVFNQCLTDLGYRMAALAELDKKQIKKYRMQYFNQVRSYAPDFRQKVFIDKMPLNLAHAGFIRRIFPNARFILALRHPCDCCLSSFMQNFNLNPAMAHLTSFEDAAKLYKEVMGLFLSMEKLLGFEAHRVRYQDLLSDLDQQTKNLCDFLGVKWSEDLRQYRDAARKKSAINTPSYAQVIQPLYKSSVGRWKNYEEFIAPSLPILEPYIEKFGYQE